MPKRSNEFQRLVRVVEKHYARRGVTVVESAMLPDQDTGNLREVDVFIFGRRWMRRVATSIECTDQARRATVGWIEEMWAKHRSLPTKQLILASRGGYSAGAIAKAAALGVTTISHEQGVPDDLDLMIVGSPGEIWVKRPEVDPSRTTIDLAIQTSTTGTWHAVPPGAVLTAEDGTDAMLAFDLVRPNLDRELPPSGKNLRSRNSTSWSGI